MERNTESNAGALSLLNLSPEHESRLQIQIDQDWGDRPGETPPQNINYVFEPDP